VGWLSLNTYMSSLLIDSVTGRNTISCDVGLRAGLVRFKKGVSKMQEGRLLNA